MFKFWSACCCGLLLLLACSVSHGAARADILDLAASDAIRVQPGDVRFWVQPESTEISDPRQLPTEGWSGLQKTAINVGKSATPVWFRFTVENRSDKALQRTLEIRWINLGVLDLFVMGQDEANVRKVASGLNTPRTDASDNNTSWLFSLSLAPGEQQQIYLRAGSRFNIFLPMYIWQQDALDQHQQQRYVWYGLAFGVLIALMLFNLSLYVFTRDHSYLYYCFYALSIMVYECGLTGVGDYLLWGHTQWLRLNGFALSIYVSFFAAALFMRHFLELKHYGGWMLHCNTFFILYWACSALVLLVGNDFLVRINELCALLSCVVALATSIVLWIKGNVSARYFTIAWGGLITLTMMAVLMMEGALPYSMITENGQLIGFVAEMLLLSFALAERINRERSQRELAQTRALDLQLLMNREREEKLQAQEAMLQLQQQTNEALEERVVERTQELERTMTNLEIANRELAKLSVTDPLTKVHNRRYFDATLSREIERSTRTGQPLSLVLVDIDHFKQFNDRYGHLVGDDCLRLVAATLKEVASRSTDLVARYGGEEFAIVLPDTAAAEAYSVAERVRNQISELKFIFKGERIPISASLGVVGQTLQPGAKADDLIEAADKALYEAKNRGRNCSVAASSLAS
ncbi:diguanylate cyclase [Ketobacter sp.]|uniref:sensor domain-containing diguanylate cyclase n=1 Tax=Ketobacter sp. TaxID=2083498 RepID=UPI0025BEA32D|nr:diguanylate cyclase [Ketobacter sp.]